MNRKKYGILVALLIVTVILALSSCKKNDGQQGAVEIVWDRDICQMSAMVISDRRFGAQVIEPNGKAHLFIEIGAAVTWLENQDWKMGAKIWVSDYETLSWIEAEKAHWRGDVPNTPMEYGFAATMKEVPSALSFKVVREQILEKKVAQDRNRGKLVR